MNHYNVTVTLLVKTIEDQGSLLSRLSCHLAGQKILVDYQLVVAEIQDARIVACMGACEADID